jgi:hypothetical protein
MSIKGRCGEKVATREDEDGVFVEMILIIAVRLVLEIIYNPRKNTVILVAFVALNAVFDVGATFTANRRAPMSASERLFTSLN